MVWFQIFGRSRTEKRDIFDSLVGGAFNMATSAMNNAWSLENSKEMADYNKDISKELAKYYQGLEWQNADRSKSLRDQSVVETPGLNREGLERAGYNPILAVSSASGAPFSQSINSPQGSSSAQAPGLSMPELPKMDLLQSLRDLASIKNTEAQTDLLRKRELGEGWTVKTLSRSEAQGLGASLLGKLGFNLHDSSQNTFLVAYNPITGELRNLGDTVSGSLGTTGEPNSAVDVVPVDWKTDKSPRYNFNPDDWELKPEYR